MKLLLTLFLITFLGFSRSFSQAVKNDSLRSIINTDSVYTEVDISAEHPKGKEARIRFIESNIDAAIPVRNGAPAGNYNIRIACIIDANGKVLAMIPETQAGYGMEKEMIRVLKKLPLFKPAIKNGIAVKSKIVFPVVFMSRNAN